MKTIIEDLTDDFLDLEDWQAERAMQNAALDAMDKARQFGSGIAINENHHVRILKPEETGPYRERILKNLEKINRKIAALQPHASDAFSLNDQPPQK